MTPQKHAPDLVEAAKQCLLSEDSFLTCTERDMLIAARKGKDCSSVGNARWVLLNYIAALTEENEQLRNKLAAFEGAEEVPPEATYTASHTVEEQVFFAIHRWYPEGTRLFIVRPKPSKQEEAP